jgi:hypothetical protein
LAGRGTRGVLIHEDEDPGFRSSATVPREKGHSGWKKQHHDAAAFYLEEKPVRETSNAPSAYFRVHHLEVEGIARNDLYSGINGQSKPRAKVVVNAFVTGKRFLQVCIRFGYPDDR